MQLDLAHFNPSPQLRVREHPKPMPGAQSFEPQTLGDECRNRDSDIQPARELATTGSQSDYSTHALGSSLEKMSRTPGALAGVDLRAIQSRAELMIALNSRLPLNEYNLPKFIYRPDLLDYTLFNQEATTNEEDRDRFIAMQDALNASTIVLQYHEGYPSLPSGKTFWSQFDYESVDEFALFEQYLKIPGARQLALLGCDLETAQSCFHMHYWGLRCLAHDTFAVAHYQRLREQRILSTENTHYLRAEALLDKLYSMFGQLDFEVLQKDPVAFVKVMSELQKLQRTALGQSASNNNPEAKPQSLELIMRNLGAANSTVIEGSLASSSTDELLNDPTTAHQAQELILRMNK